MGPKKCFGCFGGVDIKRGSESANNDLLPVQKGAKAGVFVSEIALLLCRFSRAQLRNLHLQVHDLVSQLLFSVLSRCKFGFKSIQGRLCILELRCRLSLLKLALIHVHSATLVRSHGLF